MVDQSTPARPALLQVPAKAGARASWAKGRFPLLAMAMAAALPICFFGGLVAYVLADSGRESAWLEAQATAAQVAEKVSAELSSQQQVLQTLASSTALDHKDRPDLSAFYVEAARVKLAHPLWETVELVNLNGDQVMNLFRPIGQPLGRTADRESLQEVIRTGRPVVGGIGPVGSVSGRRLIAIRVPVDRSGEIRFVLGTLLEPSAVVSLLRYAGAPKDWVGAVVDARGVVIASTSKDSLEVGQPASRAVLEAVAQAPSGSYSSVTEDGVPVETVYQSLPDVGWTVHFGISRDVLNAPVSRSLGVLALGGFASLGLAAGLALLTARDLSQRRRDDAMRSHLELLASEERGQVAAEAAELGTWRWDPDADVLTGSERFQQLLSLPGRTLRLVDLLAAVHPDDRKSVESAIRKSLAEEGLIEAEFQTGDGTAPSRVRLAGRARRIVGDLSVYGVVADVTRERQAELEKLRLLRRLADAQDQERRRISRELHDQVGQTVTGLSLGLKSLERSLGDREEVLGRVRWLQDLTGSIGREIHRVASDLRPAALDDMGLQAALTAYAQEWQQRTSVKTLVRHGGRAEGLPEEAAIAAYRITQEALNNVAKHARATQVSVLTEVKESSLRLIVEDDGVGFDTDVVESASGGNRLGLAGIRERLALVGGEMTIESTPGQGTSVYVVIPLSEGGGPR